MASTHATNERTTTAPPVVAGERPAVAGKFIQAGGRKLDLAGVTYGTFAPDADGAQFPAPAQVQADFAAMRAAGLNSLRTYTAAPPWLLDLAAEHDLRVLVGLPWEQHIAFLGDRRRSRTIVDAVRAGAQACAGHPALLGLAVGNEIPASIVRWHGKGAIEAFLGKLYEAAKGEDPEALVTYVNFPSTEFLELPFLDFLAFNVYLEEQASLRRYLDRLHNLAGDRPLVMAEIGLDSRRNGEDKQAEVLEWQIETAADAGCAGAFIFSWTDEWYRGGHAIEDWDFGLTDRNRAPKPALAVVEAAFTNWAPDPGPDAPMVSVVVCTHNGAGTLRRCLSGISELRYPSYEVIVIDDGSTDDSARIAASFGAKVISTPNRGLSAARNRGCEEAKGEIVAYIDDDAWPDPDWLSHIVREFEDGGHAAVGGPNIPPPETGPVGECVANAPGGPLHVLLDDRTAEHIPGCNMCIRRDRLAEVGGFDPQFRAAGDDVDLCWRLLERGWTIGFRPAAMVFHHRRSSVRAYLRQQRGYGKAEALVEAKWPERYNRAGHLTWNGRIYGQGVPLSLRDRARAFHGVWGTGHFQQLYRAEPGALAAMPLMPEWYLLVAGLAVLSVAGVFWAPLLAAVPLLVAGVGILVAQALRSSRQARFAGHPLPSWQRAQLRSLTASLFLLQPIARLAGRIGNGLTPLRRPSGPIAIPQTRESEIWSEEWRPIEERLEEIEQDLVASGASVRRGSGFDRWDLEIRGGMLASTRLRAAVEEHGSGKQLIRLRSWPRFPLDAQLMALTLVALTIVALTAGTSIAAAILGFASFLLIGRMLQEASAASGLLLRPHAGEPMRRRWRTRRLMDTAGSSAASLEGRPEAAQRGGLREQES